MNPLRIYDVSFISKETSASGRPEILVIIPEKYWLAFRTQVREFVERTAEQAVEYLLGKKSEFIFPEDEYYGFASCCRVSTGAGIRTLHFEMCRPKIRQLSASICYTLLALNVLLRQIVCAEDGLKKQHQYLEVETLCSVGKAHGHAIYGHVFPSLGIWLKEHCGTENLPGVPEAMEEVWVTVSERNLHQYADWSSVRIEEDGRFCFTCFGDACDVAIYPDGFSRRDLEMHMVPFNAHNLDTPAQQLTLLAGLAAFSAHARKECS